LFFFSIEKPELEKAYFSIVYKILLKGEFVGVWGVDFCDSLAGSPEGDFRKNRAAEGTAARSVVALLRLLSCNYIYALNLRRMAPAAAMSPVAMRLRLPGSGTGLLSAGSGAKVKLPLALPMEPVAKPL
jgi:hypothetical protein